MRHPSPNSSDLFVVHEVEQAGTVLFDGQVPDLGYEVLEDRWPVVLPPFGYHLVMTRRFVSHPPCGGRVLQHEEG